MGKIDMWWFEKIQYGPCFQDGRHFANIFLNVDDEGERQRNGILPAEFDLLYNWNKKRL